MLDTEEVLSRSWKSASLAAGHFSISHMVSNLRIDEGIFTAYCWMLSDCHFTVPDPNVGPSSASLNQPVDPSADEASSTLVA